ncbi:hypothetical protein UY3_00141 [Chelonia mydas]|uniref:Uncharacterized protein n=1 Tax=Chelonia mydas TaxID=8469 RepID=M7CCX1_CHEMY|nr:hypothetical protein UY3_00141 [Chelonia mydas]
MRLNTTSFGRNRNEDRNRLKISDHKPDGISRSNQTASPESLFPEHEQRLTELRMQEKQALAHLEKEAAERAKQAGERAKEAYWRQMQRLAAEERAHQMQQVTARLKLQIKKAMEEQQKLYLLGSPVYNNADPLACFLLAPGNDSSGAYSVSSPALGGGSVQGSQLVEGVLHIEAEVLGAKSERGSDADLKAASMRRTFSLASWSFLVQGLKSLQIWQLSFR